MDNMIVRQFAQDIDKLILENNTIKKQLKRTNRKVFIFGLAAVVLGVEVYLLDKELNRHKEIIDSYDFTTDPESEE